MMHVMPTPNERKGLLFLALVALSGTGVRVWKARAPAPTVAEAAALDRQLVKIDSVRSRKRDARARSEKRETVHARDSQPVDINSATAAQIETLPGIGPTLAKRIVDHRDSAGPFAGMQSLCDVRGVGPALAKRLRPLVTFGGWESPVSDACDPRSKDAGKAGSQPSRKRS
jgi:competence ComEA-like helix-hairpin-helix protein